MPLVKGLVANAVRKAGTALVKTLDPAQRTETQLNVALVAADRELAQVAYAVAKALAASALGTTLGDGDVDAFMAEVFNSPSGPARAFRLLGEARKTASGTRKRMLAAIFFGLPFTGIKAEDYDRVDMLIERLVPADVELLSTIALLDRGEGPQGGRPGCFVLTHGGRYLVGNSFLYAENHRDEDLKGVPSLDGPAFASLVAHGCVSLPSSWSEALTFNGVSATAEFVEVTPLGRLLRQSLEDVRPGFDE
jgi:hypothetical protein